LATRILQAKTAALTGCRFCFVGRKIPVPVDSLSSPQDQNGTNQFG
jgi:hypothetical protein